MGGRRNGIELADYCDTRKTKTKNMKMSNEKGNAKTRDERRATRDAKREAKNEQRIRRLSGRADPLALLQMISSPHAP